MKITVNQLRRIIKEEILRETRGPSRSMTQEMSEEDAAIIEFVGSKGLGTENLELSIDDNSDKVTISDGSKSIKVSAIEVYKETGNTLVQLAYSIDDIGGTVLNDMDDFEAIDAAQTYV